MKPVSIGLTYDRASSVEARCTDTDVDAHFSNGMCAQDAITIVPNRSFLHSEGRFSCEVVSLERVLKYDGSKTCAAAASALRVVQEMAVTVT